MKAEIPRRRWAMLRLAACLAAPRSTDNQARQVVLPRDADIHQTLHHRFVEQIGHEVGSQIAERKRQKRRVAKLALSGPLVHGDHVARQSRLYDLGAPAF